MKLVTSVSCESYLIHFLNPTLLNTQLLGFNIHHDDDDDDDDDDDLISF